jgi:hypothetical protein
MLELGDVYSDENDTDIIIYHREYSIYNSFINCQYYGMKDYVLKNFYTSVFARHRTYNLMGYNESIRRSENKKNYLLLSKEEQFYEFPSDLKFKNFSYGEFNSIFSFMKENSRIFQAKKFVC